MSQIRVGKRRAAAWLVVVVNLVTAGCSGGRPNFSKSGGTGTVNVYLSAGTPVAGATVSIYAIQDDTGQVNTAVGKSGVIGNGGPTDSSGNVAITVSVPGYSGPIQVVATGASLSFGDPTVVASTGTSSARTIQIPSDFSFTSYYATYVDGSAVSVPLTLLTTIADAAVRSYRQGLHPLHPGGKKLSVAMADRDPLFVQHIVNSPSAWNPAALRTTMPTPLTSQAQTLTDGTLASVFDVALSQLAHDVANNTHFPAFSVIDLTRLLVQDVEADGVFDGRGTGGEQLVIQGSPAEHLNSQYLRIPLAAALDTWIQSKGANASGIQQSDLVAAGVFVSISGDKSDLFGEAPAGLYNLYGIAGSVTGAGGSPVELSMIGDGHVIETTLTDSSGNYSFGIAIVPGNYTITPSLRGYTFNPTSDLVAVKGADATSRTFSATLNAAPTYSISGTVAGVVTSGVPVKLSGPVTGSTVTDPSGRYSFSGLGNGVTYAVTPSLVGYTFSPTSSSITVSSADGTGNFTAALSQISEFELTRKPGPNDVSGAEGIAAGPDGNLWFTEPFAKAIGRVTPGGQITEFPVSSGNAPDEIAAGPDGN